MQSMSHRGPAPHAHLGSRRTLGICSSEHAQCTLWRHDHDHHPPGTHHVAFMLSPITSCSCCSACSDAVQIALHKGGRPPHRSVLGSTDTSHGEPGLNTGPADEVRDRLSTAIYVPTTHSVFPQPAVEARGSHRTTSQSPYSYIHIPAVVHHRRCQAKHLGSNHGWLTNAGQMGLSSRQQACWTSTPAIELSIQSRCTAGWCSAEATPRCIRCCGVSQHS